MSTGAFTSYIDVAQIALYIFWVFFALLIFYLRREDKREGYPLESDRSDRVTVQGFPSLPDPKTFHLHHGGTVTAPRTESDTRTIHAEPASYFPGAPLMPTGNPMTDAVGPASYAQRSNTPDLTAEGEVKIVPLRTAGNFYLEPRDPDPRGCPVVAADGQTAGTVVDAWVDRAEVLIRYLEVEVSGPEGQRRAMLPMTCVRMGGKSGARTVRVNAITAAQFADVPPLANPEQITLLEEDRICAYYAGGNLYATPQRQEPVL
ncbi:photosynthetic reaction center subunit H [Pelagibius sp.]|uniref:photosynthetic reaction center subunit H n=1 Tax=Pelagibius sp. TaxID=1931238 RepID=UPI002639208F|nr:photosynthetic reaction center subunit H [Pelagibius sp.]